MIYSLGVDIGTGSTKAVAVNSTGEVIDTTQVSYPTLSSFVGCSEQAPELIWQAVVKCINRIIHQTNEKPVAVALSSAMHSVLPIDCNGNPLMNMITWADNRSATIATRIKDSSLGEVLYEQTGTPIHAMSPLCKIIWLRENEPEKFLNTYKFLLFLFG